MSAHLEDYRKIVGTQVIDELLLLADRVRHLRLQHINSTSVGGGVAEILTRMVPLLRDLGIDTTWDVIKGNQAFFAVTKAFHNALHGGEETITEEMFDVFRATTEMNLGELDNCGDVVVVHDPQPAGLIAKKPETGGRWLWRCHIDVSTPAPSVWGFLRDYVGQYDASIFSMPDFAQQLTIPQYMVPPSIDPLADKNRELPDDEVRAVVARHGLDPDRPILTQISRFDRLKDPLGVIRAYRMVRRRQDCQLLLAGGGATDDPEGAEVLREVREAAGNDPDIHVLELPPFSDLDINALVRGSTIVMQKSIKEGFGLTVTEALWKRKPVIGGAVGGIRLQLLNGLTGFLVHSPEGAANRAIELLGDPELCSALGSAGHKYVKDNFLTTRHIRDYLLLMLATGHDGTDLSLLTGGTA
ncbi:MAG: glycosyltransferase [Vicinamibacterales bacterium]|jgi:trehalose synthase|nr:glycosyltransferase [Vicinamibacterales bacterium]MDP7692223.1 glycosyltransferase [Vicinamibacterales bacterium]HJN45007.1 glycosyltransferase [Vicinamibacterales bacterium]